MLRNTIRWTAGRLLATVLVTLGPQQQAGEEAELHRKAIRSQQQALGNRVWEGERREGAGRNWKPKRQFGSCQGTSVGRVHLCSWTAAGHGLC